MNNRRSGDPSDRGPTIETHLNYGTLLIGDLEMYKKKARGYRPFEPKREQTIFAFRPVLDPVKLHAGIQPIQDEIEKLIAGIRLDGEIERIALDGLRLMLTPRLYLSTISRRNPGLDRLSRVKRQIAQALPNREDSILRISASRAGIKRDGRDTLLTLVFDNPRLTKESLAAQRSVNLRDLFITPPFIPLSYIPPLKNDLMAEFTRHSVEDARQVIASFGPVDFENEK